MRDVAKRPQALVGKAVVVAAFLLVGEPDAAQRVRGIARRDIDAVVRIHGRAVGRAAAMRDPRARARAHDRLHRRDEPARRMPDHDAVALVHVDVGLAVRHEQHLVAGQLVAQHRAQHFGIPDRAALHVAPARVDFAQQRAHLAHQRLKIGVRRLVERRDDAFTAQHRPHAGHPAAPRQLRDQHGDERDDDAEQNEEADQVPPRVGGAAVDEAHVVNQHELAEPLPAGGYVEPRHVQRRRRKLAQHVRIRPGAADLRTAERGRIRRRAVDDVTLEIAERDGVQPLVLHVAIEQLAHTGPVARAHHVGELLLHRVGHEPRADLEVVDPPAQRQLFGERDEGQREQRKRDRQRRDESQRQLYPAKCGFDIHRSGQPPRARGRDARRGRTPLSPLEPASRADRYRKASCPKPLWHTLRRPRSRARKR